MFPWSWYLQLSFLKSKLIFSRFWHLPRSYIALFCGSSTGIVAVGSNSMVSSSPPCHSGPIPLHSSTTPALPPSPTHRLSPSFFSPPSSMTPRALPFPCRRWTLDRLQRPRPLCNRGRRGPQIAPTQLAAAGHGQCWSSPPAMVSIHCICKASRQCVSKHL